MHTGDPKEPGRTPLLAAGVTTESKTLELVSRAAPATSPPLPTLNPSTLLFEIRDKTNLLPFLDPNTLGTLRAVSRDSREALGPIELVKFLTRGEGEPETSNYLKALAVLMISILPHGASQSDYITALLMDLASRPEDLHLLASTTTPAESTSETPRPILNPPVIALLKKLSPTQQNALHSVNPALFPSLRAQADLKITELVLTDIISIGSFVSVYLGMQSKISVDDTSNPATIVFLALLSLSAMAAVISSYLLVATLLNIRAAARVPFEGPTAVEARELVRACKNIITALRSGRPPSLPFRGTAASRPAAAGATAPHITEGDGALANFL